MSKRAWRYHNMLPKDEDVIDRRNRHKKRDVQRKRYRAAKNKMRELDV